MIFAIASGKLPASRYPLCIDFANGPVTSPWGKLRAQMGHPEPFHLEMLGVGNEQWGPRYVERYCRPGLTPYTCLRESSDQKTQDSPLSMRVSGLPQSDR